MTDGPFPFEGLLFDSKKVKVPAGAVPKTSAQKRGLRVFTMLGSVVRGSAELRKVRGGSHLLLGGTIFCGKSSPTGLRVTDIRLLSD
jgi:hypothetical protein